MWPRGGDKLKSEKNWGTIGKFGGGAKKRGGQMRL